MRFAGRRTAGVAMDERESSVASSVDFYATEPPRSPPPVGDEQSDPVGTKRKAEELSCAAEKKVKTSTSCSTASSLASCARLPPQVWQHVFSFCSLTDLGRLIQVNRAFLSYLTDVTNLSSHRVEAGRLRLLKSDSLWASARNALVTKPPKPLPGLTELRMWQLAWNKTCQFCSKRFDSVSVSGEKFWEKGPGHAGLRVIWPFAIRACGPCLLQQCQTVSLARDCFAEVRLPRMAPID